MRPAMLRSSTAARCPRAHLPPTHPQSLLHSFQSLRRRGFPVVSAVSLIPFPPLRSAHPNLSFFTSQLTGHVSRKIPGRSPIYTKLGALFWGCHFSLRFPSLALSTLRYHVVTSWVLTRASSVPGAGQGPVTGVRWAGA